jgi:choice-of-anchor A domain-containing protein
VLEIRNTALVNSQGLSFNVPSPSTILVNVTGINVTFSSTSMAYGSVPDARVIWKFCQATAVGIAQTGFKGTFLGPLATITHHQGSRSGQLIANASLGLNNGFSSRPFTGRLPLRRCE